MVRVWSRTNHLKEETAKTLSITCTLELKYIKTQLFQMQTESYWKKKKWLKNYPTSSSNRMTSVSLIILRSSTIWLTNFRSINGIYQCSQIFNERDHKEKSIVCLYAGHLKWFKFTNKRMKFFFFSLSFLLPHSFSIFFCAFFYFFSFFFFRFTVGFSILLVDHCGEGKGWGKKCAQKRKALGDWRKNILQLPKFLDPFLAHDHCNSDQGKTCPHASAEEKRMVKQNDNPWAENKLSINVW